MFFSFSISNARGREWGGHAPCAASGVRSPQPEETQKGDGRAQNDLLVHSQNEFTSVGLQEEKPVLKALALLRSFVSQIFELVKRETLGPGGVAHWVECLPSWHEPLDLIPSTK